MKERFLKVIKYGTVIIAAGFAYALFYIKTGFAVPCVFNLITGLKCPGCGTTHMIINIMKLDFAQAFACNPVMFLLLPVFAYLICANLYRYIKYGKAGTPKHESVIGIIIIAVLVCFGILRNILHIM